MVNVIYGTIVTTTLKYKNLYFVRKMCVKINFLAALGAIETVFWLQIVAKS